MEDLKLTLKQQIIESLSLRDFTPEDIDDNAPLFGDQGLGLDSIDTLELILLLEKYYGIKINSPEEGKDIFVSIAVMADYIAKHRSK